MPSLPEVFSSIHVPVTGSFWRKMLAFVGPGLMVSVGYMDPGNWATDLAGGAQFGYLLLSVIMISNFMAILLQHLSLKLGIATGRDLAQACRDHYSRPVGLVLWVLCEIAIAACDLAEVIGSAIALNLLFGIPLVAGVLLTAADVLVVLFLQNRGFRYVESLVASLIMLIGALLYVRADRLAASDRGDPRRAGAIAADGGQPWRAVYRDRHPGRYGDAAQPVSAFQHCPNARLRAQRRRQGPGDQVSRRSTRLWRCCWPSLSTRPS